MFFTYLRFAFRHLKHRGEEVSKREQRAAATLLSFDGDGKEGGEGGLWDIQCIQTKEASLKACI